MFMYHYKGLAININAKEINTYVLIYEPVELLFNVQSYLYCLSE